VSAYSCFPVAVYKTEDPQTQFSCTPKRYAGSGRYKSQSYIGDQSKAKENLNKEIEILKECGADGWVEKYEKELAAIS
jgi:hypothetical protein